MPKKSDEELRGVGSSTHRAASSVRTRRRALLEAKKGKREGGASASKLLGTPKTPKHSALTNGAQGKKRSQRSSLKLSSSDLEEGKSKRAKEQTRTPKLRRGENQGSAKKRSGLEGATKAAVGSHSPRKFRRSTRGKSLIDATSDEKGVAGKRVRALKVEPSTQRESRSSVKQEPKEKSRPKRRHAEIQEKASTSQILQERRRGLRNSNKVPPDTAEKEVVKKRPRRDGGSSSATSIKEEHDRPRPKRAVTVNKSDKVEPPHRSSLRKRNPNPTTSRATENVNVPTVAEDNPAESTKGKQADHVEDSGAGPSTLATSKKENCNIFSGECFWELEVIDSDNERPSQFISSAPFKIDGVSLEPQKRRVDFKRKSGPLLSERQSEDLSRLVEEGLWGLLLPKCLILINNWYRLPAPVLESLFFCTINFQESFLQLRHIFESHLELYPPGTEESNEFYLSILLTKNKNNKMPSKYCFGEVLKSIEEYFLKGRWKPDKDAFDERRSLTFQLSLNFKEIEKRLTTALSMYVSIFEKDLQGKEPGDVTLLCTLIYKLKKSMMNPKLTFTAFKLFAKSNEKTCTLFKRLIAVILESKLIDSKHRGVNNVELWCDSVALWLAEVIRRTETLNLSCGDLVALLEPRWFQVRVGHHLVCSKVSPCPLSIKGYVELVKGYCYVPGNEDQVTLNSNGRTLLMEASVKNDEALAMDLLAKGAWMALLKKSRDGKTALELSTSEEMTETLMHFDNKFASSCTELHLKTEQTDLIFHALYSLVLLKKHTQSLTDEEKGTVEEFVDFIRKLENLANHKLFQCARLLTL